MELLYIIISISFAILLGYLFNKIKLPKLLGYLMSGLIIGNYFTFFDSFQYTDTVITYITSFALSIILLKAGLGIEKAIIKKVGFRSLLLGTIPNIIEGTIVAIFSIIFLKFATVEAFMLGFIISAVSPAVVIPSMTKLIDDGYDKTIPTMNLAATSFDDVVSLTIVAIFISIFKGTSNITFTLLLAPINLLLGGIVGALLGFLFAKMLTYTNNKSLRLLQYFLILLSCILLKLYGSYIYIIEMIAIMIFGYIFNEHNNETSSYIKIYTNQTWKYAQILLFFSIGYLANITVIGHYLFIGICMVSIGLIGRSFGVITALIKSKFTNKEKLFCIISNIPKATVQAVLGSTPLLIGVTNGDIILSISALSIIYTAPIGLILIEVFSKKLIKRY